MYRYLSGCGKDLLRILAGLEEHTSGNLTIKREPSDKPLNSMVFQGDSLSVDDGYR